MKELINNLIEQSGLTHDQFAKAVGTSTSCLSQKKRVKKIEVDKLVEWARALNIEVIESYTKEASVKIVLNPK